MEIVSGESWPCCSADAGFARWVGELCVGTEWPHNEQQCYCGAWVAGEGRSVALLVGFLRQIWQFTGFYTEKQAQSQPNSDQG